MKKMRKLHARIVNGLVSVLILGMMLHIVADVALRHLAGITLGGTSDYVAYWWMVPVVSLGFTSAQYAREHIQIDGLTTWFGDKLWKINAAIGLMLLAVVLLLVAWFGFDEAFAQAAIGEFSGATGVAIWPARFVLPVAALSFLLAVLLTWRRELTRADPELESTS